MLTCQCHFDGTPLELMGPLKPTAFLKPMGPLMGLLKSMDPGVIVPPALPLGGPAEYNRDIHCKNHKQEVICNHRLYKPHRWAQVR